MSVAMANSVVRSSVEKSGTGDKKGGKLAFKSGHENKVNSIETEPIYSGNMSYT